jgi:serpin B
MKNILHCGLMLLALLGVVGCANSTGVAPSPAPTAVVPTNPPQAAEVVQSSKARLIVNAPNDNVPQLVSGNNAFAFDLYQKLRGQKGNLFYSPYSISLALAMTFAGAHGETEQQMVQTLHFSLAQAQLHPAFNSLDLVLASRGQGAKGKDGKGFRLKVANALWGDQGHKFLSPFLDALAENYGAGLRVLDMQHAPEVSRGIINQWVSGQTEGKIQDLITPGGITPDSRLVLTNAVYFNAAWSAPFQPEQTKDGPFTLQDNTHITVPMMDQMAHFAYGKGNAYQAVELPYDGNQLSMVIVLPDANGLEALESSLKAQRADEIVKGLADQEVVLMMPKWKFDSSFQLADVLREMGMRDAFTPDAADLSGMDGLRDLFISQVVHKAFVSVDEAGTEAAAATAVIVTASAMPVQPVTLTIDHPFMFFIRDIQTGTILFVGRVADPRG